MDKKIVLNVGCGKTPLKNQSHFYNEWTWKEVRVDSYENETADIMSDITDLKEIESESVDSVWACHVVEHCYYHDLPKVFGSLMRVIKNDGFVVVRVPDIGSIADLIKEDILQPIYDSECGPIRALDMIYGHAGFVEKWGPGMCHRTGFTVKSMGQILNSLGINAMVRSTGGHEVAAVLYKDKIPENFLNTDGCII